MAVEDAAVLSCLLGQISNPDREQIPRALAAFDMVRRDRTQKMVLESRNCGLLYCFQKSGIADDLIDIQEVMETQWDWICNLDVEAHCQEATDVMHSHAE